MKMIKEKNTNRILLTIEEDYDKGTIEYRIAQRELKTFSAKGYQEEPFCRKAAESS